MVYEWNEENSELFKEFGLKDPLEFELLEYIYFANYLGNERAVEPIFAKLSHFSVSFIQHLIYRLVLNGLLTDTDFSHHTFDPTQKAHDLFAFLDKVGSQISPA